METIPFNQPCLTGKEAHYMYRAVYAKKLSGNGQFTKKCQQYLMDRYGFKKCLLTTSGTDALEMCAMLCDLKPGDEVIVPAYTYSATALAVLWAGGKPIMVDSQEDFNISVKAIKEAITEKTKAIIPVDIAGFPCDYKSIMDLVNSDEIKAKFHPTSEVQEKLKRILVLSDSAHSIGAHYGDKRTGSETDLAIFSLHAVKNVTTAEGGAICLNLPKPFDNDELYKELRLRTLNCQTKDAFTKTKAGGWKYDIIGQGMKINMADVNAAIGLAQIREYENLLRERKRVFNIYTKAFADCEWAITPPSVSGIKESSYHIYALRIKGITEEQRDAIIQEISKDEVAVNVHFIPMPMLTLFKGLGYDIKNYPNAYNNYAHEISLPIYPQLSEEKVLFVAQTVIKAYKNIIG